MIKRFLIIFIISPLVIFIDQITKWFVLQNLSSGRDFFVIDKMIKFSFYQNKGIAFGLPISQNIFYIFSLIIISILFWIYIKDLYKNRKWYLDFSMGLITGGAISNVIDRIRFGYVIDFISFRIWPVFNIADIFITGGVIILIIYVLKNKR